MAKQATVQGVRNTLRAAGFKGHRVILRATQGTAGYMVTQGIGGGPVVVTYRAGDDATEQQAREERAEALARYWAALANNGYTVDRSDSLLSVTR
jgi:hypothetical protein